MHDEFLARCLVLDDGTTRVALVLCDKTMIKGWVFLYHADGRPLALVANYGLH